jgi:Fe-S cluster assembly protein SufB
LVGSASLASTYPYLDFSNSSSLLEHEATISKMSDEQLFYLGQRGIPEEEAKSLILTGFCKEILTMLPMEFALEADKLLALKLEGSIG